MNRILRCMVGSLFGMTALAFVACGSPEPTPTPFPAASPIPQTQRQELKANTPVAIPTPQPIKSARRSSKLCTTVVEDFGNTAVEGSDIGKRPDGRTYYYLEDPQGNLNRNAKIKGMATSELSTTRTFKDDAGTEEFEYFFPYVAYADADGKRMLSADVPPWREFKPSPFLPTLSMSYVSVKTRVPIDEYTAGLRYMIIKGGGHEVVAEVYINGEFAGSMRPSSNIPKYHNPNNFITVYFDDPNTPVIPEGAEEIEVELRLGAVTGNDYAVFYPEDAANPRGGGSLLVQGDVGASVEIGSLEKLEPCATSYRKDSGYFYQDRV